MSCMQIKGSLMHWVHLNGGGSGGAGGKGGSNDDDDNACDICLHNQFVLWRDHLFVFCGQLANVDRVADEVKSALKPYFLRGEVDKEEYKDIMRRAVPKVNTPLCISWIVVKSATVLNTI